MKKENEKKEIDPKVQEEIVQGLKRSLERDEKLDEKLGNFFMYPIIGFIFLIIIFALIYPKKFWMFIFAFFFRIFGN